MPRVLPWVKEARLPAGSSTQRRRLFESKPHSRALTLNAGLSRQSARQELDRLKQTATVLTPCKPAGKVAPCANRALITQEMEAQCARRPAAAPAAAQEATAAREHPEQVAFTTCLLRSGRAGPPERARSGRERSAPCRVGMAESGARGEERWACKSEERELWLRM
jgi:hypothetical protein